MIVALPGLFFHPFFQYLVLGEFIESKTGHVGEVTVQLLYRLLKNVQILESNYLKNHKGTIGYISYLKDLKN